MHSNSEVCRATYTESYELSDEADNMYHHSICQPFKLAATKPKFTLKAAVTSEGAKATEGSMALGTTWDSAPPIQE